MSLLINHDQHNQLMLLRKNMVASVMRGDADATQRSMGILQGYLLGLFSSGEIDFNDVQALEDEAMQGIAFLMNVRKIAKNSGVSS